MKNLFTILILFCAVTCFSQPSEIWVSGAGLTSVNQHYSYSGQGNNLFNWVAPQAYYTSDDGVYCLTVDTQLDRAFIVYADGSGFIYYSDSGCVWPNYLDQGVWHGSEIGWVSGILPLPVISLGNTQAPPPSQNYSSTNAVFILGGTNSSIIINDGKHPVPVKVPLLCFTGGFILSLMTWRAFRP